MKSLSNQLKQSAKEIDKWNRNEKKLRVTLMLADGTQQIKWMTKQELEVWRDKLRNVK